MDREEKIREIMELIEDDDSLLVDALDFLFGDSLMDRIAEELEESGKESIDALLGHLSRKGDQK